MSAADVFDSADRGLLYAVLDAADAPDVPARMIEPGVQARALYSSRVNPELAEAAPYLVRVNLELMGWIHEKLWADHWGILIEAQMELADLRRHLRHFLLTEDPQGRELYFRFYDPRTLRTFLPSCNPDELAEFFGPVEAYIARGPSPDEFRRYTLSWAEPLPRYRLSGLSSRGVSGTGDKGSQSPGAAYEDA